MIIIVLGSSNANHLKSRLDETINTYNKFTNIYDVRIILSGGLTDREDNLAELTEADVMEAYLLDNVDGLMVDHLHADIHTIIKEGMSKDTIENIKYCNKILTKLDYDEVMIITSDFHINRTKIIVDQIIGPNNFTYISAPTECSTKQYITLIQNEIQCIDAMQTNVLI